MRIIIKINHVLNTNKMSFINGLNNFDIVYYINLEHRVDRFEHINYQLSKTNIDPLKINKINAIYQQNFGCLGCSKSHILVLETFIKSGHENCIILEDDFEFIQDQELINHQINRVFNELDNFDVLLLSSNTILSQETKHNFIVKIIDSQTTSGYAVSRQFAPILLENYKEGAKLLSSGGNPYLYSIDMYIKKIQPNYNWYCLNPKIGKQTFSWSDIENDQVDYDC